jgi:hypothetical protein
MAAAVEVQELAEARARLAAPPMAPQDSRETLQAAGGAGTLRR